MNWALMTVAVLAGMTIFSVGLRLTGQVTIIVGLLGLSGAALGFSAPKQWRLTATCLGVGVGLHNLYPPPYHQDARHLALYGPPRPISLPFGLTGDHVATTIAITLILLSFLFVATGLGSIAQRFGPSIERLRTHAHTAPVPVHRPGAVAAVPSSEAAPQA